MRSVIFIFLLIALLPGCATQANMLPPAATSRDLADDRVLVTLAAAVPSGVAALSASGRLDYQPPSAAETRETQRRIAEAIAEELDLGIEEDWPIPALDVHCFVFRGDDERSRDDLMAQLAARPEVESVQPLQFFESEAAAGDPLAGWNESLNEQLLAVHARATGRNVTIAVIDAGVETSHEDLDGSALRGVDFVDGLRELPAEMHGTAVVGVLAARPDNGIGIRGYAPDASIIVMRACWEPEAGTERAVCNSFTLARAMSLALQSGADIVNMSINGPRDPLLERLGAEIVKRDVLLVAAGDSVGSFPASIPGSIPALRDSSAGNTLTLLPGNRYGLRNGSSMRAAKVTGIAALLRELQPGLSAAEFMRFLESNGKAEPNGAALRGLSQNLLTH